MVSLSLSLPLSLSPSLSLPLSLSLSLSLPPSGEWSYYTWWQSSGLWQLTVWLYGSVWYFRLLLITCLGALTCPHDFPSDSSPFSLCPSVPLSLCPSVPLPLCPSVPLSLCPSAPLSLCPSVPLPLCPSVPLSLCLSAPLPLCPSVPLSLCIRCFQFELRPELRLSDRPPSYLLPDSTFFVNKQLNPALKPV